MPIKLATVVPHCLIGVLLLFDLAIPCLPQNPAPPTQRPRKVFPAEQEPVDVLRFDTDLVAVDVTAIDAAGQPVRNLRQEDFKLYSDDAEQPVAFFQVEKREGAMRPVAIVLSSLFPISYRTTQSLMRS